MKNTYMPLKSFDVITIGAAVRDITFYTDDGYIIHEQKKKHMPALLCFPYGGKISTSHAMFTLGGGACNSAVSLSRLGFKTAVLSCVGDDVNGKDIHENLRHEGIDTKLLAQTEKAGTGVSFIVASKKTREHVVFAYRGASSTFAVNELLLRGISTKWLYVTALGGSQKLWQNNLRNIFSMAVHKRIQIAWNPGGSQLKAGFHGLCQFIRKTDIFMVNTQEAIELVSSKSRAYQKKLEILNGKDRFMYLCSVVASWGPKIVVVTDGPSGAYAYEDGHLAFRKGTRTKPTDTTGAGDSFNSSFIASHIIHPPKKSLEIALELGTLNADSNIREVGAQTGLLTWKQLYKRLRKEYQFILKNTDHR